MANRKRNNYRVTNVNRVSRQSRRVTNLNRIDKPNRRLRRGPQVVGTQPGNNQVMEQGGWIPVPVGEPCPDTLAWCGYNWTWHCSGAPPEASGGVPGTRQIVAGIDYSNACWEAVSMCCSSNWWAGPDQGGGGGGDSGTGGNPGRQRGGR